MTKKKIILTLGEELLKAIEKERESIRYQITQQAIITKILIDFYKIKEAKQ
jgi:hypothetical protein